jgi:hypothetical protein
MQGVNDRAEDALQQDDNADRASELVESFQAGAYNWHKREDGSWWVYPETKES